MARNKKNRTIQIIPHFKGFKTIGMSCNNAVITINLEEYEAIKLCDYEFLTQEEASKIMNVSRPTFTRIYESARRNIAKSFIEGLNITFEGGNIDIIQWYKCHECESIFTILSENENFCPLCKNKSITKNTI